MRHGWPAPERPTYGRWILLAAVVWTLLTLAVALGFCTYGTMRK